MKQIQFKGFGIAWGAGMKRFLFWMGGVVLFLSACVESKSLPTIDIQRAVELTVSAISANQTNATMVPDTQQPVPNTPTFPATDGATQMFFIPGCSLIEPQFEVGLVTKVVDGDTIDVAIAGETFPVRYIGIDTAEPGEPNWREAHEDNRALVEDEVVTLVQDVSARDSFDRLLRYVVLGDGTFVNEELVRRGFARAVAYPPDTACEDRLNQAQWEAQEMKVGIWAEVQATETPPPVLHGDGILVDPSCSQFNAPGDDNKNKNEEYVCLQNPGDLDIDLSGWRVEDEYGWTYTFPAFSLEAGSQVLIHTGCGTDTAADLFWCRDETAIWNNGGDCVHLIDQQGEQVHEFCY